MARDVSVTAKCQKPDEVANEQDDPCDGDARARFSERYLLQFLTGIAGGSVWTPRSNRSILPSAPPLDVHMVG